MELKENLVRGILPQILSHVDLRDLYKRENVKQIQVAGLGGENNFMISSLFTSCIKFSDDRELKLVVKYMDQDEETQKTLGLDILFANEHAAFGGVLETLGVTYMFPKCYYSCLGTPSIVVMQDIRELGYRMTDSMSWLSKEHILLAVRKLGLFHGKCYALKEKNRKEFDRICGLFREGRYKQDQEGGFYVVFVECAQRGIRRFEKEIEKEPEMKSFLKEIQESFTKALDFARSLIQPSGALSVLCHGDYTRNNVMFTYDERGNPEDLMMVDLQTFRFSSPATDLSVFLCLHYSACTLMSEWDEVFGEYHNALIAELCAGLGKDEKDLPSCYSLTSMGRDFSQYSLHGYYTCTYFLGFINEPLVGLDPAEFFGPNGDPKVVLHETMTRGGETVTQALADILKLIYKLRKRYGYVKAKNCG